MAAYLNQHTPEETVLAASSPVTIAPLVGGRVVALDETSRLLADHVLVTALDWQIAPEETARFISGARLEHVVRVAGQELFWLYDPRTQAEVLHLATYVAPGDLVLCDAASPFCRSVSLPGQPVRTIVDATEAQIVDLLNAASTQHTRLWYLTYPGVTEAAAAHTLPSDLASPLVPAILRRQLDSSATLLEEVDLDSAAALLYILPQEPSFVGSDQMFSPVRYDGQLAVTGVMLYDPQPTADGPLRFYLRWAAESVPQGNYRVFVHLLEGGARGHLRQAGRGQELLIDERGWPTSYWEPGGPTVGRDYSLGLPPGLPPGDYRLVIGVANAATEEWLPVVDAEGRIVDTTGDLLPVQIGPPSTPPDPDEVHLGHPSDAAWPSAAGTRAAVRFLGHSAPSHAQAGQTIVVEAGWTSAEAAAGYPGQDLEMTLGLIGPDGTFALRQTLPLSRYPTSRWRAGEVIHELYDLRLPADLPGGAYTLALSLLDGRGQIVPLDDGAEVALLDTLRVYVQERLFELPQSPQQPLELSLGSSVTLLGYDLLVPAPGGASDRVSLTLYWRAEQPMETSYSVFVHLLDEAGRVKGQRDRIPMEGRAPTTGWIAGQIVVDEYEVPLAEGAPPGVYRIEVGMYDPHDMTRLQMVDAEGRPLPGDRFLLPEEVDLAPAP